MQCPDSESCIRVMTGAVRPDGVDAVVPVERIRFDGETANIDDEAQVEPGRFIHTQGSDRTSGETRRHLSVRWGTERPG